MVTTSYKPIPTLFKEEMRQFMTVEYIDKLPILRNKKDSLYRARREEESFECCEDILLPESLAQDWLCVKEDDFLIFVTEKSKEWLANCKKFFADGTFRIVPEPFVQLYTFHADIGSTADHTRVLPCIYVLLPNKQQETYEKMFKSFQQNIPGFQPDELKVDFEKAAINAFRKLYPLAKITGCYFHFSQALYNNAEKFNILSRREGCTYVAKCAALAHLPAVKIHEGWIEISSDMPQMPGIKNFNEYMSSQWVQIEMIHIVSCFKQRHRTNNVTESWHKKINNIIRKNSNILLVLSELKDEAQAVDFQELQNDVRPDVFRKRAKKYIAMDMKIDNIVNNFLLGKYDIKKTILLLACLKY
ncbi:uncharacterized protein LOC134794743 [Cydia splendana]|uniref:uncharacterized protein LOC134794743 n=1 Tax=Cydia splendana TaxID=1100963 RepID=UPI00300D9225